MKCGVERNQLDSSVMPHNHDGPSARTSALDVMLHTRAAGMAPPGTASSSSGGLWVYIIDTSEAARSEDVSPNRARYALSSVRSLSKAALSLPQAPEDAAVVVAARAPRVLVPPGADDGGLLFADPWQPGSATAGDNFELLPALRLALLLCRQRAAVSIGGVARQQQQQQLPAPPYEAGRVVMFICSGVHVTEADVAGALRAMAAPPAIIGLDIVLLGGAAQEVDQASMRCLVLLIDSLNESSSSSSVRADAGASDATASHGSGAAAALPAAAPPCTPGSDPVAGGSPVPVTPQVAAAPGVMGLQQHNRHPRARLVCFEAPDPDLPSWQQLEPLLELLELPTHEQYSDDEVRLFCAWALRWAGRVSWGCCFQILASLGGWRAVKALDRVRTARSELTSTSIRLSCSMRATVILQSPCYAHNLRYAPHMPWAITLTTPRHIVNTQPPSYPHTPLSPPVLAAPDPPPLQQRRPPPSLSPHPGPCRSPAAPSRAPLPAASSPRRRCGRRRRRAPRDPPAAAAAGALSVRFARTAALQMPPREPGLAAPPVTRRVHALVAALVRKPCKGEGARYCGLKGWFCLLLLAYIPSFCFWPISAKCLL